MIGTVSCTGGVWTSGGMDASRQPSVRDILHEEERQRAVTRVAPSPLAPVAAASNSGFTLGCVAQHH